MSEPTDDLRLLDNPTHRRYEAHLEGRLAGFSQYRLEPPTITVAHTTIEPELEGKGIGSQLVRFLLDDARSRGLKVVPLCPFVRSYIRRHTQYADLVAEPDQPGDPRT